MFKKIRHWFGCSDFHVFRTQKGAANVGRFGRLYSIQGSMKIGRCTHCGQWKAWFESCTGEVVSSLNLEYACTELDFDPEQFQMSS
jgi:hypothetical protein